MKIIMLFFVLCGCANADGFSKKKLITSVLLAVDGYQTYRITQTEGVHETNVILNSDPSKANIVLYFSSAIIAVNLVPKKYEFALNIVLLFETAFIANNAITMRVEF